MNEVDRWLESGAGAREGLRLLSKYAPNEVIERLVTANPARFEFLLDRALKPFASGAMKEISVKSVRNYTSAHAALSSCSTLDECFEVAKKVIENYRQNRKILSEFAYFQEHGVCLGKHPIFQETRRVSEIRSMNILQLVRMKKNLEGAIWRAKNEMAKGDRPHLDSERQERIDSKTRQLREVERLIEHYENDRY